jgi:anti-sigma B factor antagonist
MPDFEVRMEGKVAVVTPHGDVLASSMPELRPAMRNLVQSGIGEMVVDLTSTVMIDSTGLGLLLAAFNSMTKAGGKFSIVHASAEIVELLETMRMHQHFSISGR